MLRRLQSDPAGLSSAEAAGRLLRYGPNELRAERPVTVLAILARQFRSPLIWLLVVAAGIAGAFGDWVDGVAILAIVVLNAVIGCWQEYGAERALAALRRLTGRRARVRRDGRVADLRAVEVVPGDVIELAAGDLVPADARLLESSALRMIEASLTGESVPVEKAAAAAVAPDAPLGDRAASVHAGTSVAAGSGVAVVVATGMATEMGKIAELVAQASAVEPTTPLQRRLHELGRLLVWACLAVVALVFLTGLLRGIPALEMLLAAISLAVAAVPEGLPAVVTIALAVGVQRMARRRALVRRLHAVETLGAADLIAADKTGTLTAGDMTVRVLVAGGVPFAVRGEGYDPAGEVVAEDGTADAGARAVAHAAAFAFAACSDARLDGAGDSWRVVGDPTEGALLALAGKLGIRREAIERDLPVLAVHAFDSARKRMTIVRNEAGRRRAFVKGAPDIVLARCTHLATAEGVRPLGAADRARLGAQMVELAGRALRVLAAAERTLEPAVDASDAEAVERDLVLLGFAGMYDPPRPGAKEAVARCRAAGIRVVMITGDHPQTALAVARELGIASEPAQVIAGPELAALDDAALARRVAATAAYARVTAEHKLRLVRALQAAGHTVAMTGDGVNDAPALKGAEIGVAMGRTGTEVAKEAADMVITDDDFASIVAAVEEGRGIYANIRKTLAYLLAGNLGELLVMGAAVVGGLPIPLLPIHILWINLITDGPPALCLAVDPIDPEVMRDRPRPRTARIVDGPLLRATLTTGFVTAAATLVVYAITLERYGLEVARAHAFSMLVFVELLRAFPARSESKPFWRIPLASNLKLALVVVSAAALQFAAPYLAPLGALLHMPTMPPMHGIVLLVLAAVVALGLELVKIVRRRRPGA